MITKNLNKLVTSTSRALFSTTPALSQKQRHTSLVMDPKFYEKDFFATGIEEIEFIRSPYYDLSMQS